MLFAHRQTDQGAALLGRRCYLAPSALRLSRLLPCVHGQPSSGSVICAGVPLALRVWTAELQL